MWLCLDCQKLKGKSLKDATWKDDRGFIPNVIDCSMCKQERVCAWFGAVAKSEKSSVDLRTS